jgi:hypothetical protein
VRSTVDDITGNKAFPKTIRTSAEDDGFRRRPGAKKKSGALRQARVRREKTSL